MNSFTYCFCVYCTCM